MMFDFNATTAPFLITGVLSILLLVGVVLRRCVPLFRKSLLPASIIAGVLGFILINAGVVPVDQSVFEVVSFHLLNLSFMSITLASTKKVVSEKTEGNESKKGKEKNIRGGLWLAMMWGALISVQIVVAGFISVVFWKTGWKDFNPLYGMLSAHGLAQGPVQALSMAKTWISSVNGGGIQDAVQVGLFFAMAGYLAALLIGVPICNFFFKKNLTAMHKAESDKALENGIYARDEEEVLGRQTTHRSNIDTFTFQWALMLGIYFITYMLVSLLDPEHNTMLYSMMFVWTILVANFVVFILRRRGLDYMVDPGVQNSITNFCTDVALVACMMSVTVKVILQYIVPLFAVIFGVIAVTIILTWFFAKKTGKYAAERFVVVFGIATGTAITGLLLLRILDSQGKTPVTREIVWWNVFQMFTGMFIISLAPFAAIWGWGRWLGINVVAAVLLLIGTYIVGRSIAKPAVVKKPQVVPISEL